MPELPEAPLRSALLAANKTGMEQFLRNHLAKSASCPNTPSLHMCYTTLLQRGIRGASDAT